MAFETKRGLSTAGIVGMVALALAIILLVTYGTQYYIDSKTVISSDKLADKKPNTRFPSLTLR